MLGPISISDYFSTTSKVLIGGFITQHFSDQELAQLILLRKKNFVIEYSVIIQSVLHKNIHSVKSLDDLIANKALQHGRLPILLK